MKLLSMRSIPSVIAALAIASLVSTPASAASKKRYFDRDQPSVGKVSRKKAAKRAANRRVYGYAYAAPRPAYRGSARYNKWYGWGASFHFEGVRYPGGTPSGPANTYNNFEGGFHPEVFWKIWDRHQ